MDDAGKRTSIRVHVPSASTPAQMQALSNDIAVALDAITGCRIESAAVTTALTLPGTLKSSVDQDALRQVGANFSYDAANSNYSFTVRVPAFPESLYSGGEVNVADALIAAFNTAMVTGDGTIAPSDEYANDLSAFNGAALSFWTK
jgi:hypothetical protein